MAKLSQKGDVLTIPAPTGGVTAGNLYLIGGLLCLATETGAAGAATAFNVTGVHDGAPADNATAFTVGAALYWNDTDGKIFNADDGGTGSGHPFVGHAAAAKAEAATTCSIRLQPSA